MQAGIIINNNKIVRLRRKRGQDDGGRTAAHAPEILPASQPASFPIGPASPRLCSHSDGVSRANRQLFCACVSAGGAAPAHANPQIAEDNESPTDSFRAKAQHIAADNKKVPGINAVAAARSVA
jgi:hypothetical protein